MSVDAMLEEVGGEEREGGIDKGKQESEVKVDRKVGLERQEKEGKGETNISSGSRTDVRL